MTGGSFDLKSATVVVRARSNKRLIPLIGLFVFSLLARAGDVPPLPESPAVTGTNPPMHATFCWDSVTNATFYAVIVRSNGIEVQRKMAMTNSVVVSNLFQPIQQYQFTAIATNSLNFLVSDESAPAVLKWCTVTNQHSYDLTNWFDLPTNGFQPNAGAEFFRMSISNFDANLLLKPD